MRLAAIVAAFLTFCAGTAAQAGDLSGRVLEPRGAPAGGLVLQIEALGLEAITDADGSYAFAGLPAGEHEIAVMRADGGVQYLILDLAEADMQRNIMLFSAAAADAAFGLPAPPSLSVNLAATLELADRMSENAATDAEAWHWRDLDG